MDIYTSCTHILTREETVKLIREKSFLFTHFSTNLIEYEM